ncbi:MAG: hypothetical protein JO096_09455 [Alphaproteobacteria bacterium]|nr:hypothetical protein [Alphaproteobacteria bacterium]
MVTTLALLVTGTLKAITGWPKMALVLPNLSNFLSITVTLKPPPAATGPTARDQTTTTSV